MLPSVQRKMLQKNEREDEMQNAAALITACPRCRNFEHLAQFRAIENACPRSCLYSNVAGTEKQLMAMKILLRIGLAAVMMAVPLAVRAADKAPDAPKTERKARSLPFNGKVGAVDKTAKTITLEGKARQRVFQVTSETRISKDKKPAVLDDVQVGDRVGGSARENADGKMELVSLNVLPAKDAKTKQEDKGDKGEKKPAN